MGSRFRQMSDNVGSIIFESGVVENVGVAYTESRRYVVPFNVWLSARLFGIRHLEIRMSLDMSRDQFYTLVGLF